ncbi:protein PYRICULARIA ORYZAE RESISTANCE 21 [Eucalyptus grandis]|uniref:protein PYRICULARIA ORYZAE RESISTANCE 21 n=1 Tax=Eucalyptus grandis TaxID=71139 RepID=UPI00192EA2EE|nr:protein PYRICULARIA ORYZAE RESISTANCE 21 [Eucalyptus grandis]
MAEQVTEMVIKVDLQCCRCSKKIKKILCEIPQVKDLIFDEKQNKVKIKVVGCDPEKVRQKICCKGRAFILGIDIIPPEPPKKKEPKKEEKKTEEKKEVILPTPEPSKKPPPVIGYPPGYMMGKVYVCISCHHGGCGWFCPCNCHCGGPPICADGCGRPPHECICKRPPMCHYGCGRPAYECSCQRPIYPWCCDRYSYGNASSSWTLHGCDYGRPPACTNAGYDCDTSCTLM